MANTYTLIASNILSSSAASVTFSSIPSTYTDLVVKWSARGDYASANWYLIIRLNGSSSSIYSQTTLYTDSTTVSSNRTSNGTNLLPDPPALDTAGNTSNTFTNNELYIPSYTASQNKPISYFGVVEQNTASSNFSIGTAATLFSSTSAISSIYIAPNNGNFVSGSSFFLYGIKNS